VQVLALTKRTRALLPHIPLSVTVPHTLALPDQVVGYRDLFLMSWQVLSHENHYLDELVACKEVFRIGPRTGLPIAHLIRKGDAGSYQTLVVRDSVNIRDLIAMKRLFGKSS
jgi:hypothetical protein